MTSLEAVGIFVGIPLAVFILIALAVAAPSWSREARYRPGLPWDAGPVWFNGPPGEAPAERPRPGTGGAGGAW